jgi:hypothetical protein
MGGTVRARGAPCGPATTKLALYEPDRNEPK